LHFDVNEQPGWLAIAEPDSVVPKFVTEVRQEP
jgi:hypothetical protein